MALGNTANIKAVITAEDRASKTLKGFGDNVGTFGNKVKSSLKIATVAAAGASAALLTYSLNQFRDIQNNVAGIKALTKNTAEAKKVLKDTIDFVQGKPFDRLDTIGAAKQLLAFGRTANQVKNDLDILGRTVIISGIDWQSVTRVYGRVVASGKLLREDFNILNDAGVGLAKSLQKNLGLSMEEVFKRMSEGKISAKDFKKALEDAAPSKAVQASLNTFDNKFLSLKASIRDVGFAILGVDFDQLDEGGRPLVKPGGLLDKLQDGVESVTEFLRSPEFKKGLDDFTKWLEEYIPKAIETFTPVAEGAFKILKETFELIVNNKEVVAGLVASFVALKTAMLIGSIIQGLTGMFAIMAGAGGIAGATTAVGGLSGSLTTLAAAGGPFAIAAAVGVGAAVAIALKWKETNKVIASVKANIQKSADSMVNAKNKLEELLRTGDAAQRARAEKAIRGLGGTDADINRALGIPQFAGGTSFAPGGMALVGERGPELVNLPRGSKVTPNNQTRTGNQTMNFNVNIGMYAGTEIEKRKVAKELMRAFNDAKAMGTA